MWLFCPLLPQSSESDNIWYLILPVSFRDKVENINFNWIFKSLLVCFSTTKERIYPDHSEDLYNVKSIIYDVRAIALTLFQLGSLGPAPLCSKMFVWLTYLCIPHCTLGSSWHRTSAYWVNSDLNWNLFWNILLYQTPHCISDRSKMSLFM
jgi:hypothetical protein